jgi:putative ABC transport system permease protein
MGRKIDLTAHYMAFAFREMTKKPLLSVLSLASISVGVAATMTMVAVLHLLASDPIPSKSGSLYWVHLRPGTLDFRDVDTGRALTWPDASNLLAAHRADNQAANAPGRLLARPDTKASPFYVTGQYVTSEFFPMFDTPFIAGQGWSAQEDSDRANVAVLNRQLAVRIFGSADEAVGKLISLNGKPFTVTGVLDAWHPSPAFYSGKSGDWAFMTEDEFFLPLHTALALNLPIGGGETCWGDGGDRRSGDCAWVQFWIELKDASRRNAYLNFLNNYWEDQSRLGRFPLRIPPRLTPLMDKLKELDLVPTNVKVQSFLALVFFLVCLFNACGITFAKLYSRHREVSIRRAMGASLGDIATQFGAESLLIGLLGGLLGLLLTNGGIWIIHRQPYHYAKFVRLDWTLVTLLFFAAIVTSMLAAILPTIRSFRTAPATSLN